ncbi:hypothetical protein RINTHH_5260 [Richelia intracellularis HH01]|jgi:hypothetical protein|uniref:Uncharacterized protein n=1 Tax=Richelia intracellularis HH01 TaxID=1165094 RepID=M1X4U1_9NOST|nr:T3SS effector HopA1 family protein [Richelia intracellularis]CCH66681.1 hypothetical protein RINTHH_5260 [Richelia intracellularis HH01]HAE06334.1 hypothetical protein [Richelia sp.]
MLENTVNKSDYLSDIIENVNIESKFCINHHNYNKFTLSPKIVERLKNISLELQQKYLHILLKRFIYGIYFSGRLKSILSPISNDKKYLLSPDIESESIIGVDWKFYKLLNRYNHGVGHFDPDWQIRRLEPDGSIAVVKNGLHLHIEPNWLIKSTWKYPKVDDAIMVWMNNSRLDNGFYVAVSNIGLEKSHQPGTGIMGGGIYFNVNSTGAINLMDKFTTNLNNAGVGFRFQVPCHPDNYQCMNSGTLYFDVRDYKIIINVVRAAYQENKCHFYPETPLFTKYLAPGIGFAEQPISKISLPRSFGMQGCQIMANALIDAWERSKKSSVSKLRIIRQHFAHLGIDLQFPYLNPYSCDIYDF